MLSLVVFLGAFFTFLLGALLGKTPGAEGIAGLMLLGAIPAFVWSLALAILGLRQCIKHPQRYPRGKALAVVTLVLGTLVTLLLIPAFASGIRGAMAGAKARRQMLQSSTELLKFDSLNFAFHPPGAPWNQADARMFGRGSALAFARAEPMFFTVCANPLEPGWLDPRARVVEWSQANLQRESTSCQLLNQGEVIRNGISGWQTETEAAFQGRQFYLVHWLVATNGFGYQLAIWGPPSLSATIKREADRMFSGFEPTAGGNSKAASTLLRLD